jgi:hypothetical protein
LSEGSLIQFSLHCRLDCALPDWFASPRRALGGFAFIAGSDQRVVAQNFEDKTILGTPNHVKMDGFIIDLEPFHGDAFWLLVGRFEI